jgi:hypothetical protein
MNDKEALMIPFHALNEFMRPDFRMSVVRSTLNGLAELTEDFRADIDRHTKKIHQDSRLPQQREGSHCIESGAHGPIF